MKKIIQAISNEIYTIDSKIITQIANKWVKDSANVQENENVMIYYDIAGRQLAKEVAKICSKKGCRVWYRVRDLEIEAELIENLSEKNLYRFNAFQNTEVYSADTIFIIRAPKNSTIFQNIDKDRIKIYNEVYKPVLMDYRVKNTKWELMYWPTKEAAQMDNMTMEEYFSLFIEASNQDWPKIAEAQEKLVKILDKADHLRFKAYHKQIDKYTDVEMSIKGQTFINSTIDNNFPGSEVFSSPIKKSVEGIVYLEGLYTYRSGLEVINAKLEIKEGKIIKATAEKGEKELNDLLDTDEGSRYFGEIALGTNPGLRKRMFNSLLNEKVGGSFHITPGKAYKDEICTYSKQIKKTYNGNDSTIHWDITIMMLPQYGGGEVIVDGKVIQKDGKFLIEGLEILNNNL